MPVNNKNKRNFTPSCQCIYQSKKRSWKYREYYQETVGYFDAIFLSQQLSDCSHNLLLHLMLLYQLEADCLQRLQNYSPKFIFHLQKPIAMYNT